MTQDDANDDARLAHAFVQGVPGARDALLGCWLPRVLRWAARLGGPAVDAEDVAQDVFIVVIRRLADVEDLERVSGWLYGVTRKVVAQHRRRAWLRRWVPGASTDRASDRPGPEAQAQTPRWVWPCRSCSSTCPPPSARP